MTCTHHHHKSAASQPPLYWLAFTAEGRTIGKAGATELLSTAEARAASAFSDSIESILQRQMDFAARQLSQAIRVGDTVTASALRVVMQGIMAELDKTLISSLTALATPYSALITQAGFEAGAAQIPSPSIVDQLLAGEPSQRVIEASARTAQRMAQSVADTTAQRISDVITTGVEENLTGREVMTLLEESGISADRSQAIARTETANAYMEGQTASWEDSGVVTGKKWLVSPFACEFCEAASAAFATQAIGLRDSFYAQGTQLTGIKGGVMSLDFSTINGPPLHPNCRCDLLAELEI